MAAFLGYSAVAQGSNGPGGLVCCAIVNLWILTGINADGMLIGRDQAGFPFISSVA